MSVYVVGQSTRPKWETYKITSSLNYGDIYLSWSEDVGIVSINTFGSIKYNNAGSLSACPLPPSFPKIKKTTQMRGSGFSLNSDGAITGSVIAYFNENQTISFMSFYYTGMSGTDSFTINKSYPLSVVIGEI